MVDVLVIGGGNAALCAALMALFVALPVLIALTAAFYDEAGKLSITAIWDRIGNERTWGLSCVIGGQRCGVAWNTLFIALLTGLSVAKASVYDGAGLCLAAQAGRQRG